MRIATVTLLLAALAGSTAFAETVAPGDVAVNDDLMVAEPLTAKAGDAVEGRKLFANRKKGNCLACHANAEIDDEFFHGEIGPSMNGVALRYEAPQLRAILVNSKAVFGEETIMPSFYREKHGDRTAEKFAGKPILEPQEVEDVIAYLQTLTQEE